MYLELKNLGKKKTKNSKKNYLNAETITEAVKQQTRLIKIERLNLAIWRLIKKKLRNLPSAMQNRKPKKRCCYNDVYSDDGIESDDEFSKNDGESSNEEIVKKKTQARKGTVARMKTTTTEPATKKRRKNNKKEL